MMGSKLVVRPMLARFRAEQDGTLTVFTLMLFLLMVMMGGLAVDLMRYEATRTTLQNTLDRATLAAASLTQELDGEVVVNDYFAKAGMTEYLNGVTVSEGVNFREVEADASAETNPFFTHMIGLPDMDAIGHSTAEQRVTNVEIVLVLDVSGSMGGAKLTNLKKAAKDFVDSVLSSDPENRISISIVPYNAQVNLGATLLAQYNSQYPNGVTNVNCLEIPSALYDSVGISRTTALSMSAYADWANATNKVTSYVAFNDSNYGAPSFNTYCNPTAANIVRLPSNNTTTLKTQIDALVAESNTSIMLGLKWGMALLDPASQPMFATLSTAGAIPSYFNDRPYAWDDPEAMKLIVLMTDGEHVDHDIVTDAFKGGLSPIYRSTGDGKYSIRHVANRPTTAGTNEYYTPHLGTWSATPYNSGAGAVQQDWADVWKVTRLSWVAWQLYARALATSNSTRSSWYNTIYDSMQDPTDSASTMDTQLQKSCTQAKTKGVIVYGIAFEAPTGGQTQIKNCATSAAHYYNASGLQISSAFKSIASNISQLRLTQ
jgi:Flp pilus assembly protein TadG